jgi:hypothetical protein
MLSFGRERLRNWNALSGSMSENLLDAAVFVNTIGVSATNHLTTDTLTAIMRHTGDDKVRRLIAAILNNTPPKETTNDN